MEHRRIPDAADPLESCRIVVVALPGMLSDLIRRLAEVEEDGCEVFTVHGHDLVTAAEARNADVVVAPETATDPGSIARLLSRNCWVRAITVDDHGGWGVLYELRAHRTELGELSPSILLRALFRRQTDWSA